MVTIGDHNPRVIRAYGNHHGFGIGKRINLAAIHDRFYSQEAEQHLILSL